MTQPKLPKLPEVKGLTDSVRSTQAFAAYQSRDSDLIAAVAEVKRVSESSKSEARWDHDFQDGSGFIVTSREGGDAVIEIKSPPAPPTSEEIPS